MTMKFLFACLLISNVLGLPHVDLEKKSAKEIQDVLSEHFYSYIDKIAKRFEKEPDFKLEGENQSEYPKIVADYLSTHPDVARDLDNIKMEETKLLVELYAALHKKDLTGDERDDALRSVASKESYLKVGRLGKFTDHDIEYLFKIINEHIDAEAKAEGEIYHLNKVRERITELKDIMSGAHSKAYFQNLHDKHLSEIKGRPKMHRPGSIEHLRHIWTDVDDIMSSFNPGVFFKMHDLNGDGIWDPSEVESLIANDLRRLGIKNKHERYHEEVRERKVLIDAVDSNKDGVIEKDELLSYLKSLDAQTSPEWKLEDELDLESDELGGLGDPGNPDLEKLKKALEDLKPETLNPEVRAEWELAKQELEKIEKLKNNPHDAASQQSRGQAKMPADL